MSDEPTETVFDEPSRRSFMKKGALATGAAMVGLSGTGSVAAQPDESGQQFKALMYANDFHPNQQFRFVSGVIDYAPEEIDIALFSDFNTRLIEYVSTGETVPFFPAQSAEAEMNTVYDLSDSFALFENNEDGVINVSYSPTEDQTVGGGGGNQTGGNDTSTNNTSTNNTS
ncbi:twin-arginine translocation signal domain-containing protein [Halomarina halobia]|uniref:Twin-arginine translocation signal domain-containing protein n=1 Tax=Halomarina halobia TaxID=3033386 RepID=A0ABD6ACE4_9EURY|nr:twin-arginine translocation signal domain-containing protein [Halomarina sp. PSR21]